MVARLLDRLSGLMPNVRPIVFDYTPECQAAAQLRAEPPAAPSRSAASSGRTNPSPYIPTGKAIA